MKCYSMVVVFTLASVSLFGQVSVPKLGIIRFADGTLRRVLGLPFNLIVSDLLMESADAVSFSNFGGLVSRQGIIRLLGPDFLPVFEYHSQEASPLLSLEGDLETALVWLPSQSALLHWDGTGFAIIAVDATQFKGKVTNLQLSGANHARLLVSRPDDSVLAITISLRSGAFTSSENIPGVRGLVFTQNSFYVYVDQRRLVVDNARGYYRSLPLPASALVIERMSNDWLHLSSVPPQQDWALHLTLSELELSVLPSLAPSNFSNIATASAGAK